jgi:hypothetical protein
MYVVHGLEIGGAKNGPIWAASALVTSRAWNGRLEDAGGNHGSNIRSHTRQVNFFHEINAGDDLANNGVTRTALLGIGSKRIAGILRPAEQSGASRCWTTRANAFADRRTNGQKA